jgi:predicted phosphodiesterase
MMTRRRIHWTPELDADLLAAIRAASDAPGAAEVLTKRWGRPITSSQAYERAKVLVREHFGLKFTEYVALARMGQAPDRDATVTHRAEPAASRNAEQAPARTTPGAQAETVSGPPPAVDVDLSDLEPPSPPRDRYAALVSAARRPGATVESVCNALDLSPAALARLIAEAKAAGIAVDVAHEAIAIRAAAPSDEVQEVAQASGHEQRVAAISDTHFGSRYCMRQQLVDFVRYAYEQGCREVLHAGDFLDGCYRHGRFELSHHGIDDQADDAIATLPRMPGLRYLCVAGNHDQTFTELSGVEVGRYIEARFRSAGRDDVRFYGNAGAWLRVRGVLVHLWHPRGGVPYALSYRLQKQIESYAPGHKPDVLLAGHLHKSVQVATRGVHGFLVPCWQSAGSAFSNSLVGQPVNGGLILSWRLTAHGTLRALSHELVTYYLDEGPRRVAA